MKTNPTHTNQECFVEGDSNTCYLLDTIHQHDSRSKNVPRKKVWSHHRRELDAGFKTQSTWRMLWCVRRLSLKALTVYLNKDDITIKTIRDIYFHTRFILGNWNVQKHIPHLLNPHELSLLKLESDSAWNRTILCSEVVLEPIACHDNKS